MTGNNAVETIRGTGILVNNFAPNGDSTINITSGTTTVLSDYTAGANDADDGIEATTHNGGAATINIGQDATVNVTVAGGGNGILIQSVNTPAGSTGGGNIVGTILGTVNIDVTDSATVTVETGNGNNGIKAATQGDGTVDLTTGPNVTINTHGPYAVGIHANAAQGYVTVNNAAEINTGVGGATNNSNGIEAYAVAGDVTVRNGYTTTDNVTFTAAPGSGAITTTGDKSNGILAYANTGDVGVFNAGEITPDGSYSDGINAYTTVNAGVAGKVIVDNSGIINSGTLTPDNNDHSGGILAYSQTTGAGNTGTVEVKNTAAITADGSDTEGIHAYTSATGTGAAGDVTVTNTNSGEIKSGTVTPNDNVQSGGIYAYSETAGAGNTGVVKVTNAAAITVDGDTSEGIHAYTSATGTGVAGNVIVDNSGDIKSGVNSDPLKNANSDAIYAYSGTINSKTGTVTVTNTDAEIVAVGDNSAGIRAVTEATGTGNAGDVTVTSTGGSITSTTGKESYGIFAQSTVVSGTSGTVSVTNSSTITTAGETESDGIAAESTNGKVYVDNSGTITTSGTVGDNEGIYAIAGNNIDVINSGAITTNGIESYGIYAQSTGASGIVSVTNSNTIITQGGSESDGIHAESLGANGTVSVDNSNAITTSGSGGDNEGIYAVATKDVTVKNSGAGAITTNGASDSVGIYAQSTGAGKVSVTNSNDITTTGTGMGNYGIYALSGTGTITATNSGLIETAGIESGGVYLETGATGPAGTTVIDFTNVKPITTTGASSPAIWANGTGATGDVLITNTSPLATGTAAAPTAKSAGIQVDTIGGNITIDNSTAPSIKTTGDNSAGISATSQTGTIGITNGAAITTLGGSADGITATTGAPAGAVPAIKILNTQAVTTTGGGSNAIYANATGTDGDVQITNQAQLTADKNGIQAITINGPIAVTNEGGITATSGDGILAETDGGDVTITNNAKVTGEAGIAATATAGGVLTVNNGAAGNISGTNAGVLLSGAFTAATINNDGIIGAKNDLAINTVGMTTPVTINNNQGGIINGYMTLAPVANTLNNAGTWNLKNSADTAAGTVARADMGDGAIVNNNKTGVINLVGDSGAGNAYVPLAPGTIGLGDNGEIHNANNVPQPGGPVEGEIMGVKTFTNSGTIDLTNGGVNPVGSVLVISGSPASAWQPGVSGGGVYVSDGGTILMHAVLNQGGAASKADVLVVDSTKVASGPTTLVISKAGLGAYTPGDGVPVVEVLDKTPGSSAPGAFQLALLPEGRILTAGAYQYTLNQNGYQDADGNWYLRDTMIQPGSPAPAPAPPGSPAPAPAPIIVPNYRPEVPVYMTAPALAQRMGLLMLGTYHHRVGEDRPMNWRGNDPEADLNADAKAPAPSKDQATDCAETARNRSMAAWGRAVGQTGRAGYDDHTYSQFRENGPDYDFNIGALQAGFDVLRVRHDDLTRDNAGLYLGFMRGTADVHYVYSNIGRAGRVDMNGYSLGGYWTHKGVSEWYLDGVLQGTRYDQAEAYSEYTALNQKIYPNGYGIAASLEAGIPFGPREGWRWEPQAQLIYQFVTLDNGADRYGWVEYGDTSTWYGRIGARLTKDWVRDQEKNKADNKANCDDERKRSVWARINLWHSFGSDADTTFTALNGMGTTTLATSMGDTWGQLGLGVSWQLGQRLSAYVTGDYNMALTNGHGEAFSGEVGLRYEF